MIKFELTKDNRYLKVTECNFQSHLTDLKMYFTKKSPDGDFNAQVDAGLWDGMDHFLSKDGKIPVGLWREVWNFSKSLNIPVEFNVNSIIDKEFNKERYDKFVTALFKGILTDKGEPFYPRDYQYEGAYRALKYRFCCEELATSSGKTAIFYIYLSYIKFIKKISSERKAILIVPNVSLVGQTYNAFKQFQNGLVEWNIMKIGGKDDFDPDSFKSCDLIITTYQSMLNLVPSCIEAKIENLIMKPLKKEADREKRAGDLTKLKKRLNAMKVADICSTIGVVTVDESHKSKSNSIGKIIESCVNWEYRLGLSGTMKIKEDYSDFFMMQERTGPLVMTLSAKFLIDKGYSPKVKIKQVFLEYDIPNPTKDNYVAIQTDKDRRNKIKNQFRRPQDFGKNMLEIEKGIIFDSEERHEFITRFIKKLGKNTLIMFTDIKNEYGKTIVENIKKWNEHTYYIDGGVDTDDRDDYKKQMESRNDVILVCSYATFATGIDIKNVYHIVFVESIKSEITVRQAVGRGMRFLAEKNEVIIWDIIDNLYGYSVRHSEDRMEIYTQQQFEILNPITFKLSKFK